MEIQLTQEHIDRGQCGEYSRCPIALALLTRFTDPFVSAGGVTCFAGEEEELIFWPETSLVDWFIRFDMRGIATPITLLIDLTSRSISIKDTTL